MGSDQGPLKEIDDMDYPGVLLKVGSTNGSAVKALSERLSQLGYVSSSPPGVYDANLASLVKVYQARHTNCAGQPLRADGVVGPVTWAALFAAPIVTNVAAAGLGAGALVVAASQLGVREDPSDPNTGPEVNQYLASVGVAPGASWCMAFVSWCFQQAASTASVTDPFPHTASCLDAWSRVQAATPDRILSRAAAIADPRMVKPGMVFILDHGGGHGHTGFVKSQLGGALRTIEGNSNANGGTDGVGVFDLTRRTVMEAGLKGFLDFTD